ncbi:MAG: chemotaxis response regulator protein-glutamate methylesterase [Gammaproteobacteria bacterium]|nr:chemotaxis response regulator protein-glutamate methylesterase [Gammaproteobacteria bacterium]
MRVLVVDDSIFFQRRITEILQRDPAIEVVGKAGDGVAAVAAAQRLQPDVITMDVDMPMMDGISAVRKIMQSRPTPIIMLSAFTQQGAEATLNALEAGALDFLPKNHGGDESSCDHIARHLPQRIHALGRRHQVTASAATSQVQRHAHRRGHYRLLAIGASTGGPVAIQQLLTALPANFPLPVLVVVHMPESFTPAFAERLNGQCRIGVKEAHDGDQLMPGQAYLAPGGKQMLLEERGGVTRLQIVESRADQTYRPSVDVTLASAAEVYRDGVLAVILTGMGADGKQGASRLKQQGSTIWSQDQQSCVVYGMPQAVEKAGLADRVLPLHEIGPQIVRVM